MHSWVDDKSSAGFRSETTICSRALLFRRTQKRTLNYGKTRVYRRTRQFLTHTHTLCLSFEPLFWSAEAATVCRLIDVHRGRLRGETINLIRMRNRCIALGRSQQEPAGRSGETTRLLRTNNNNKRRLLYAANSGKPIQKERRKSPVCGGGGIPCDEYIHSPYLYNSVVVRCCCIFKTPVVTPRKERAASAFIRRFDAAKPDNK